MLLRHYLLMAVAAPLLLAGASHAADSAPVPADPIVALDFRELPLGLAMRQLSRQTGIHIIPSQRAAAVPISGYLADVPARVAIRALCRAHDLWYQDDRANNLIQIFTVAEYHRDLETFRAEETQVFTLKFPNAIDVAYAIRDLYGERVQLNLGADEETVHDELQRRLERFGLLNQFSDRIAAAGGGASSTDRGDRNSRNDRASRDDERGASHPRVRLVDAGQARRTSNLAAADIQVLESAVQSDSATTDTSAVDDAASRAVALANALRQPNILVSVMQRHNMVMVRTSDPAAMREIAALVHQLDVPTPMVLLHVQILSLELGDGLTSMFDYQFASGNMAGGFTGGTIAAPAVGALGLQGTGLTDGAFTAQVVNASFAARLQLLKEKNRVTALASPVLLTANNEVSGLFIGDDRPIVIGFTEPLTIQNQGGSTTIPGAPQTRIQEVGTTLLLTPTINADRSVTLRIMQENSNISANPARILVPTATGQVVEQSVDVVQRRTLSGTVMAQDQTMVAIGGLIEEGVNTTRAGLPILGDLPGVGVLFRREQQAKYRRELILLIQPYVLSTAADGEKVSRELLDKLSLHPSHSAAAVAATPGSTAATATTPATGPGLEGYRADDVVRPADLPMLAHPPPLK